LNVKPGTLSVRLSRAKALLRDRLLARGVEVPAAAFAAVLADLSANSAHTPNLIKSIQTAVAGMPTRAAAVADGVTRMTTLHSFARRSAAVLKVAELRGKNAPDLGEVAAWKGNAVKLADLKGKVVLLKFFNAGEMTDIVHSMPALAEDHTHYAGKGLVVIGVHYPSAFNEQITTVKQLDEKLAAIRTDKWPKEVPFPIALMKSQDGPAAKAYGLGSLPILIDKKGKVVGYYNPSANTEAELTRLEKLLDEK
jgi:glutathione peroxidase-family protein